MKNKVTMEKNTIKSNIAEILNSSKRLEKKTILVILKLKKGRKLRK